MANEKKATRAAYGETLIELANAGVPVVAVEADLSGSTTTKKLGDAYPERLFNVGIAEQDMVGVAAGLSLTGKVAFTGSFAVFGTGRVYDQIRNTVCYANLDVKIAPTHAGVSVGPDGGSHQMVEDIALMRVLPNMRVLVPADFAAAKAAIKLAAETPGPVYIRMGRASVPCVYDEDSVFEVGRAKVLREGDDVTIVACGVEIDEALKAAENACGKGRFSRGHRCIFHQAARRRDHSCICSEDGMRCHCRRAFGHRWTGRCRRGAFVRKASSAARARRYARLLRHVGRNGGAYARVRA